jgi:hypothetical protein
MAELVIINKMCCQLHNNICTSVDKKTVSKSNQSSSKPNIEEVKEDDWNEFISEAQ